MLGKFTKLALKYKYPVIPFKSYHTTQSFKSEQALINESFMNGTNSIYLEQMYDNWHKDKTSVHPSWDAYFTNLTKGVSAEQAFQLPPTIQQNAPGFKKTDSTSLGVDIKQIIRDSFKAFLLVKSYMRRGHEIADVDPLNLNKLEEQSGVKQVRTAHDELDYKTYGFTEADLEKEYIIDPQFVSGILKERTKWKLGELIDTLKRIYCGKIGFEYMHISDRRERNWLRDRIEHLYEKKVDKQTKILTWERLCKNESFSNYCKNKFNTSKRFGIEGCDTLISGLGYLIDKAAEHKVENIVIGMPHRGRLNTLSEILGKPYEQIFAEFQEIKPVSGEGVWGNSGDVKYHLGSTYDREFANGHKIRLNLLANPSHLEAVDPVICGKTRATQDFMKDQNREKSVAIAMHGDASFAGQGIVYETLQMQDLVDYTVGGTIHIVVNNQIGFTTTPKEARTGLYCTDVAKTVDAPIIHVNADEPDLVDDVFELALDYRMKFKKDFVVDLIGYRRYGHNELDQPAFTQPLMYKIIGQMPPVYEKYTKTLIDQGVISKNDVDAKNADLNKVYEQAFQKSKSEKFDTKKWRTSSWEAIITPSIRGENLQITGIPVEELKDIGRKTNILQDITPHPQIKKIYDARLQSIESGKGIDWGTAEALAWSTLITEGFGIRLSGQDVERGTFSHRHAVVNDQTKDKKIIPIFAITPPERRHLITISNSHLSEFGVLGFEYGYSIANPNILVMWEAQFGDFANEAQVMIDNFIVSGESKWGVPTGITLLLPHGFDGQGPEHSSARLERFLQLSDDNPQNPLSTSDYQNDYEKQFKSVNLQIANPTTAANYFHLLRRQVRRTYRKPLIVMSPKKLLKYRGAGSNIEDFSEGKFHRVIDEVTPNELVEPSQIKRVIFCSGQVYYDLFEKRKEQGLKEVAIVRIEQLSPFPYDAVRTIADKYKNAKYIWSQEEHFNNGAWSFVEPRINRILIERGIERISYAGRKVSAATATGSHKIHVKELDKFLAEALIQNSP